MIHVTSGVWVSFIFGGQINRGGARINNNNVGVVVLLHEVSSVIIYLFVFFVS